MAINFEKKNCEVTISPRSKVVQLKKCGFLVCLTLDFHSVMVMGSNPSDHNIKGLGFYRSLKNVQSNKGLKYTNKRLGHESIGEGVSYRHM